MIACPSFSKFDIGHVDITEVIIHSCTRFILFFSRFGYMGCVVSLSSSYVHVRACVCVSEHEVL